ncbi:hypothetical protein KOR42_11430 [Thalassoglobus neptunius]|uniref:Uncharacterized protein n=1 Tax=Thalassoglobus neptunius TaxID=1938619 RepID=A0A5C5X3T3_9PLAN|nr:hypothetical protein [Thalassoglobus neptunius]TWT57777.1 hypothetical protein KOR42_11430 [Thalassoglobus neptunius]
MAKKAKTKTSTKQSGVYYGIRCTDDDSALFERTAFLEGFSSVQQWLLAIGRKRARAIVETSQTGNVRISETIVVPEE